MKKRSFNWKNIIKVPDDQYGIYSIWARRICVYVGKAEKQSIRERLLQHYAGSHNDKLDAWLASSHQLWFAYESVENISAINAKERNRIKNFAPLTNKVLQKKEYQYGLNSSCI